MWKVFVMIEIILLIMHVVEGFFIGETNHSRKNDIINHTETSTKILTYTIYSKICKLRNANLWKHYLSNFTKTPLANFDVYFSKLLTETVSGRVPPRSIEHFQAPRFRQFLHLAFMVVTQQDSGYVLKSEPQTLRDSLKCSHVTFAFTNQL